MSDKKFYRYIAINRGDEYEDTMRLHCVEYYVLKETEKSYWIVQNGCNHSTKKLIRKPSVWKLKKAFARDNKKDALNDFLCRYKFRIRHLRRQLENSENVVDKAKKELKVLE